MFSIIDIIIYLVLQFVKSKIAFFRFLAFYTRISFADMTALYILLASHIFLKIYNIIGELAVSEPA